MEVIVVRVPLITALDLARLIIVQLNVQAEADPVQVEIRVVPDT